MPPRAPSPLAEASGDDRARRLLPRRLPLQERSRKRLDAILAALVELLGEMSFEQVTTAAIAERAGVPIGSLYHFFPSKEGILAELAGRKFQAVDAAFATNLARDLAIKPWRPALESAAEASIAAFRSDPAYVTVWRATRTSPAFRAAAAEGDERLAAALEALPIVAALPPLRARVLMRTAIHLANSFLDWVLETEDADEAASVVQEMKRVLVAYLAPDLDAASAVPGDPPKPARRPPARRRQKA